MALQLAPSTLSVPKKGSTMGAVAVKDTAAFLGVSSKTKKTMAVRTQVATAPTPVSTSPGSTTSSPGGKKTLRQGVVVITGASSGLGLAAAKALAETGKWHVVMACRDFLKASKAAKAAGMANGSYTVMHLDLASLDSVRQFVDAFRRAEMPLDVLVCNAAIYRPTARTPTFTADGHEMSVGVNHLGHFLLARLMMEDLQKSDYPSRRLVIVGSITGNVNTLAGNVPPKANLGDLRGLAGGLTGASGSAMIDGDESFDGAKAYKDSKVCNMLTMQEFHRRYHEDTGITFSSLYPGCIATTGLFREHIPLFRTLFPPFQRFVTKGFVSEAESGKRLAQVVGAHARVTDQLRSPPPLHSPPHCIDRMLPSLAQPLLHSPTTATATATPRRALAASTALRRLASPARRVAASPLRAVVSGPGVKEEMAPAAAGQEARPLRVGLVCGGPSAERGISLNSARSVLDHIQGEDLLVSCYYIDCSMNAYGISPAQLYSNTPSDFDFKLESLAQEFRSLSEFADHLSANVDIVFPVIHGKFGEDGGIQELLEKKNIPFVGTPSNECRRAFDKHNASLELEAQGFLTVPNFLVEKDKLDKSKLEEWFRSVNLNKENGKVVVKPTRAGSSIGVVVAYGTNEAAEKAEGIIAEGIDDKIIIEVFLEGGCEFTAIVIDVGTTNNSQPIVLLPTEVELLSSSNSEIQEDTIFNYRRKYLPTQQVAYHTPPRFPTEVIDCIREGVSLLFRHFGLRDFARIDGWFIPRPATSLSSSENGGKFGNTEYGIVLFTDINLISGMEQTSFLFQQASKVGFSHSRILRTIVQHACSQFPSLVPSNNAWTALFRKMQSAKQAEVIQNGTCKQKAFVIFGGDTSERQVSLMSGTNVWLNLQGFDDLDVTPCLLTPANGYFSSHNQDFNESARDVWTLPYSLVLRHTTEEVCDACFEAIEPERVAITSRLRGQVMKELEQALRKQDWFAGFDIADEQPSKYSLQQWINHVKEAKAVVFIAVHGGIGEDGTIQSLLESAGVPYTGPGPIASRTCMDKVATSLAVDHLASHGIHTIPKDVRASEELLQTSPADIWNELKTKLQTVTVCVKPARDGCSTGVARLCCPEDLEVYTNALRRKLQRLPANCLSRAHGVIEMPVPPPESLIFEPYIETDEIIISNEARDDSSRHLVWKGEKEWLEITVGVVGKRGEMHSLNPSITVKESGDILSLEEKFQGGTGINLTPPPASIMSEDALQKCKSCIEMMANTLELEGFSRIDAFVNVRNGEVLLIEVNTVPGMTPSTVLIHQALTEEPPIYPHKFFRTLLDLAFARAN